MWILAVYLLVRNSKVYKFTLKLIDLACAYNIRHLQDLYDDNAYEWFCDKYSYEKLLFSFKPLSLKYWFTEDEILKINS